MTTRIVFPYHDSDLVTSIVAAIQLNPEYVFAISHMQDRERSRHGPSA